MLQVRYDINLAPEIKENKIDIIKNEPFTVWDADVINIQKQKYYLLVEKDTSFPILLTKLDTKLFNDVFANAIKSYDFILFKQQQKLVSVVKSKQMSFYDTKSQASLMLEKICKLIEDNQNEYLNLIDVVKDEKNMVDKLTVMSAAIFALDSQIGQNFISKMIDEVSTYFPIKPQKPNRRYKYVDLVPKFEDFSNFEKYENKPVKGNEKIVAKIKENNQKLIDQYAKYVPAGIGYLQPDQMLPDYLNHYLLRNKIHLVTNDLGEAISYLWIMISNNKLHPLEIEQITNTLKNFYVFLSRVGLIRKTDSKEIGMNIDWVTEEINSYSDQSLDEDLINDMIAAIEANPKKILKLEDLDLSPQDLSRILEGLRKDLESHDKKQKTRKKAIFENQTRNRATYEIRVKLKSFKPSTWRRFIISGNTSVKTLEVAMLDMFNADFGHMFDLLNKKTQERFENVESIAEAEDWDPATGIDYEKAKVSYFEKGDKLLLTYDYGDSWEFEVDIKNITTDQAAPKCPKILSGKSYGIIDDIGGVWSLQDYYDTPKDKVDPEMIDLLMGGEAINLDNFNKEELNQRMEQYKN
ncbi:plasmid pRiA4b ORF-3 family protein [Lactobacillus crispatus]|uniref:Plasmid pRiA4b ORF-3 family protein n=1 Tax=Lactobacillus crispatus TaxID=47770 RepID=A0AB73BPT8_9LACO|nr:plasmid pRiA4b ORF-3 family protein [Lactobacillus crispatus]KAA8793017.1 plasmid pRiA4b ORF-3 family protein [Lactobacillus crispatus]KAA8796353.1 plasmid pRiA4b ORF-3 family protein [Lactobacillus crispatus]KAA8797845.1 plasmid pRiA4b ORF-3 family protein [Lactobacillus crispatus]KAA8800623.1 plasmid pRiA4b ORF-3 family protein [Lactobacillus crispatus]KAA8805206.1 plasmid pRiA4b ORF-3 family protein [Lactobacillus crispatus]